MYLKKVDIINFFDDVMKREVVKFCDRINESDADVFILMARKAACFFQVLVESGYINHSVVQKMIVTDRSTDFSNNYLIGKKILIIDDVIFSGSTIAKMVLLLKKIGVDIKDISILILALNKDTFKMHFSDEEERDIFRIDDSAKLNNIDCTRLCADISRLLSVIGKPYDVDFPAYHDIFLDKEIITPWSVLPQYWTVFNVSNEYHIQAGIEAFTIVPSSMITDTMWQYLNMNLNEIAEYKIRIYSYEDGEKNRYKILPMVVFNEISFDILEKVFERICDILELTDTRIIKSFSSQSSKMRMIQYYIANLLYYNLAFSCELEVPPMRKYSLPYLFGYDYLELITEKLVENLSQYKTYLNMVLTNNKIIEKMSCSDKVDTLGYKYVEDEKLNTFEINLKLLSPFVYWYNKQELPARERLANPHINLVQEELFEDEFRLEVGFSFRSLKKILYHAQEYYDIDNLISVFIDRAVDLGLLVPIIYINNENNTICRAFRHGEDLPFGDHDKEVLLYFLNTFYGSINNKEISHIQFQKVVTLFLQLGIRENLFNVFLGFDNSQLLTVKYCIHGAVPVVVDQEADAVNLHPYVKKDNYSQWLSERLIRTNVIEKNEMGVTLKTSNSLEKIKLARKTEISTKKIAKMIAEWYNISATKSKKSVFTDDVIILTSCLNIEAFSSAILAELYICRADWNGNLRFLIKDTSKNTYNRCKNYFLNNMRTSNVFTAMNSGRKKYLWFKKDQKGENQVQRVVKSVSDLFNNNDEEMIALNWDELWEDYLSINQSQNIIDNDIMECVGHIYCYNICYRILEYLVMLDNKSTIEHRKKIKEEIEELKQEYDLLQLKQPRINYLLQMPKYGRNQAFHMIYTYMIQLDKKVEDDMLAIEQYISKSSNQYLIKYHSCIIFDFDTWKSGDCIRIILDEMPKQNFNRQIVFPNLEREQEFTRIVVAIDGIKSQKVLLEYIARVYQKATGIKIHCMVIPVLPVNKEFRLNCKINSQANLEEFREKIIIPLESLYSYSIPRTDEILFITKQGDLKNEPKAEDKMIFEKAGVSLTQREIGDVAIPYCKEEYSYMRYSNTEILVGIIAIIPEEFNAVRNRFSMKKVPDNGEGKSSRIFYEAFTIIEDKNFHLILTQAQGQGNQAGTSAYYGINMNFRVDYIVLLGIAGSVNEKNAKIGDVVIARSIYDGQLGKEIDGGFKPETRVYSPNAFVNSKILDYMNEANGKLYKSVCSELKETFSCIYEPIGDNGHLITTKDSEFVNNLQENVDRKIVAVEMESAGVAYGVYQGALEGLCERLIVIRGISDYADPDKSPDNEYHVLASENAVTIFDEILKYL